MIRIRNAAHQGSSVFKFLKQIDYLVLWYREVDVLKDVLGKVDYLVLWYREVDVLEDVVGEGRLPGSVLQGGRCSQTRAGPPSPKAYGSGTPPTSR